MTKHATRDNRELTPEFVAELRPHRSLRNNGFMVLMGFISVVCFLCGILFWSIGAWPVFLFMGLDVLIVYIAFKINYREGRIRERVSVSRDELKISKLDPNGRVMEYVLNPFWAKFKIDRHEEYGINRMWIVDRETKIGIGSFLSRKERESFAMAFSNALASTKA